MSESKNRIEMVVNYVPGEECRVAVMENGNLEEFHAERADAISHVGNIYVGRVTNVEPSIQAAFVDFGLEANGFLHVSDVHPQYFPGEGDETTERVGKKTPRRERPPIQECFRRGDEVAVQVLKEGVGTKGPTVTSYLSIPGRFLVMMPKMDRVGVSRKVEDEEQRRKMRDILDQLELPEGFGFIVRTAGMERNKTELKRDLAYLQRLWKDMEKRWKKGNKPRLLYSESDLLVRALRDMLTTDVDRIVIDNEHALGRAARFLKIVAPRSSTKLLRYKGSTPIFHALGVEQQIRNMYAREVPLPSGGRLVIDETEALVAIDVNSGKMRDARDAETNAYKTNLEATDEICRQLRLRDLGGIVINDLIDMRSLKHRREIEAKFKENLKKDRARTTLETISDFGILEMTRQRMRGSHESVHFADCPTCRGRGLVQKPDSVATDAMREMATLLQHNRVVRVEMVVSPRIAGELLSSKRRALTRLERTSGKQVDVRISEAVPVDRVTFYCYDDRGADLDVGRLEAARAHDDDFEECDITPAPGDDWAADLDGAQEEPEPVEAEPAVEVHDPFLDGFAEEPEEAKPADTAGSEQEEGGRRGRRRRGGRGRGGDDRSPRAERGSRDGRGGRHAAPASSAAGNGDAAQANGSAESQSVPLDDGQRSDGASDVGGPNTTGEPGEGGGRRRRRRRRRGRGGAAGENGGIGGGAASNAPQHGGTPILDPVLLAASGEGPKVVEPSSWDVTPEEISDGHRTNRPSNLESTRGTSELAGPAPEDQNSASSDFDSEREGEGTDETADASMSAAGSPAPDDRGNVEGGGERRGRRRRRRRRGGGGNGGETAGGTHAGGAAAHERGGDGRRPERRDEHRDEDAQHDDAAPEVSSGAEAPAFSGPPNDNDAAAFDDAGEDAAESTESGSDEAPGGAGESGSNEGGGRRRRRRRRGRGRGEGGGAGGGGARGSGNTQASGRQPESGRGQSSPPPSRDSRGHGGSRGSGGGGGGGRDGSRHGGGHSARSSGSGQHGGSRPAPSHSPPPAPEPKPNATGMPAGAKPVRVLYSSRRKLAPSEIKKIKPD